MPRGDYTPEIRTAMGDSKLGRLNRSPPKESPADVARDAKAGIKEGSPQDAKLDAMPQNQARPKLPPQAVGAVPPMGPVRGAGGMPSDLHHVAAATSIAHAILNHRGRGV